MENEVVLLDTSILIDHYRKKDKTNTYFFKLAQRYPSFLVSSITIFEIYTGIVSLNEQTIWDEFLVRASIVPFDTSVAKTAAHLNQKLKQARKQIDKADLFIAATAIAHQLPLATLNKKHFERIGGLELV